MLSQGQCKYLKSLLRKKIREIEGKYFVEGIRLCEEVMKSKVTVHEIIVASDIAPSERLNRLIEHIYTLNYPVYTATPSQFNAISDTQSPQGIACVVAKNTQVVNDGAANLLVGLDSIRDPGNLGTILRSALWFGVDAILTSKESADLYNPKVVRSSMGALFHLQAIEKGSFRTRLLDLKAKGFRVIGSDSVDGVTIRDFRATDKDIVLIGNEAHGLTPSLQTLLDVKVNIPKLGAGESLNAAVAASIILYELTTKSQG